VKYRAVVERDREELEILLRSSNQQDVQDALLSAAYYDPDWKWVQANCITLSHHPVHQVRQIAATCLGHLARMHRQLDLEPVLQRLAELKDDPLAKASAEDALDDIRVYLKFQ
jgi:hypothetical protein